MRFPERLAIVDVEGNGGRPPELVELAVVHVDDEIVVGATEWLVRPVEPISTMARRVHGITDDLVRDRPSAAAIAAQVHVALADRWVVGHNVGVDASVLARQFPALRVSGTIDTLRLARLVWPAAPSHGLDALRQFLGLVPVPVPGVVAAGAPHRAMYDSRLTAALLLRALAEVPEHWTFDVRDSPTAWTRSGIVAAAPQEARLF